MLIQIDVKLQNYKLWQHKELMREKEKLNKDQNKVLIQMQLNINKRKVEIEMKNGQNVIMIMQNK